MCNICDNIKDKSYLLTESIREELRIGFIDKVDDYIVNQYYINCATENGIIGYPIQYCPVCGAKLEWKLIIAYFNRIDLIKYKIRSILLFYKIFKILA